MGAREDAQAALDHKNFVYQSTNDVNQRNLADENYKRAQARADASPQDSAPGKSQGKPETMLDYIDNALTGQK